MYPWLSQALRRAPQLTEASLNTPCISLPYPQLSSLVVRSLCLESDQGFTCGLEMFLHFLSGCKQLETLAVQNIQLPDDLELRAFDVELPSLRELALLEYSDREPNSASRALLGSLITPSLVELRLHDHKWPDSHLFGLIPRHAPRIEHLVMDTYGAYEETLVPSDTGSPAPFVSFLRSLSYLRNLRLILAEYIGNGSYSGEIDYTTHAGTTLSALTSEIQVPEEGSSPILPHLESIYPNLMDIALDSATVTRVLDIAASRAPVSLLKELTLVRTCNGDVSETEEEEIFQPGVDLTERMKELAMEGVRFVFGTSDTGGSYEAPGMDLTRI
ncbi:hypothetical protein V5O48_008310 [Marasmius crinis-equi]|uniref:Uncharacterized protein n=1 Tax=Marasmius crinis-equi TaxID=585013 RepID=A0ABR3FE83_9AGAR